MIDIHCHILPGLDDGPKDEETAIAMCRLAAEAGTTELVATPHNNARYPYDLDQVQQKLTELQNAVGDGLHLHRGCDMRLTSDNVEAALKDTSRFTINGHQYLLVEFSDEILLQGTSAVFSRFREAGLVPVVTHPERNQHLRKDLHRLRVWVERGCLVQVTADSLLGYFGGRTQRSVIDMMDARLVHFVASDGHSIEGRPPVLDEAYDFVADRWGDPTAQHLFIDHPWSALWGEIITPPEPAVKRRRWWRIFR